MASRIQPGDGLICYVTRLSRWVGYLKVVSGPFEDSSPIFVDEDDPFVVRFNVEPTIWLTLEKSIPIHDDAVWAALSFTRELRADSLAWTGRVRSSLGRLDDADGDFLLKALKAQEEGERIFPLNEHEARKITTHTVVRPDKTVTVSVPDDSSSGDTLAPTDNTEPESRKSTKIQALLARIGTQMGMDIWIPKADRNAVGREWDSSNAHLLERLPLNYDDTTLRTIEQIDVLWLQKAINRSCVRSRAHDICVFWNFADGGFVGIAAEYGYQAPPYCAPESRREKVFQEIRRPVFSLLDRGPLADSWTFIPYDALEEIAQLKHLNRTSDLVLDDYAEDAE